MFNLSVDDRISLWVNLRNQLESADDPLDLVWEFWRPAPFMPYNNTIDPYHQRSWPTPWEIIAENRYDDFTKALMIGWTLKMTQRHRHSLIQLKIMLDNTNNRQYNVICVEESWVINLSDDGPEPLEKIPESFLLENLIELTVPR